VLRDMLMSLYFVRVEGVGVEVGLNEECGVGWYDEEYVKEKLGEDWSFSDEWSESDEEIFKLCGICFEG